jgi:hypothetical protein
MSTEAIIGLEVLKLDEFDERAPWRMTVDVWDAEEGMLRYQLTGMHYERRERTIAEIAAVQGDYKRRHEIAERLDGLDREAAAKIAPIVEWLRREQVRVIHGDEGVALLDSDAAGVKHGGQAPENVTASDDTNESREMPAASAPERGETQ